MYIHSTMLHQHIVKYIWQQSPLLTTALYHIILRNIYTGENRLSFPSNISVAWVRKVIEELNPVLQTMAPIV